jgi:hypothetical protein
MTSEENVKPVIIFITEGNNNPDSVKLLEKKADIMTAMFNVTPLRFHFIENFSIGGPSSFSEYYSWAPMVLYVPGELFDRYKDINKFRKGVHVMNGYRDNDDILIYQKKYDYTPQDFAQWISDIL